MSDDFGAFIPPGGMGPGDAAAASAAAEAGAVARAARTQVAELSADVERLYTITQALWEILRTQHGYDEATLRNTVTAFQQTARARKSSGAELPPCAACGRPASRRRASCMYCGADTPMDPFAR